LPCGGSRAILDDLLRSELGFTGTVVADYDTTALLMNHHRIAATKGEAAQRALEAGLDMELPHLDCYGAPLRELIESGVVSEDLVNRSVLRVLALKDSLGLFGDPFVDEDAVAAAYDRDDDRALAREAAIKSLVLLHNDGVLPLQREANVVVYGAAADDERLLQGDYSYPAHTEIMRPPDAAGPFYPPTVTPLAGIRALAAGTVTHTDDAEAARTADVAICFVGGKSGLTPDCTSGEFRDASELGLPREQVALVNAVTATGTPTVVVVISGRVHALDDIDTAAGIYAWLPGEQGGAAIADVLYGIASPSGRLPISLPRRTGQVPIHHDVRAGGGRSAIYGDYVDAPSTPLYRFGFGISYTEFAVSNLRLADAATTSAPFDLAVDVTNTGERDGDEVVQLFLRDQVARVARPERQLAGFTRVALAAGAMRTVTFTVDPSVLAYYDEGMRLVIEPGAVHARVGSEKLDFMLDGPEREIAPNDRQPTRVH
jgi:beta-glucosidase